MSPFSRRLFAAAALLLIGMYFFPLWQITLEAPQYPEGLGMNIFLHTVEGDQPNDLSSINNLNHYIGMKRIEPDSIPELRFMPFLIAAMMLLGLLVAWLGRRWMALSWIILFLIIGAAGLVDFYMWEYSYGHDLDPRAIIKIPGMSYQPPFLGSEQILNFLAHSYPGPGVAFAILSIGMAAFAWWSAGRGSDKSQGKGKGAPAVAASVAVALIMVTGCSQGPREIDYGKEDCAHCKMTITDARFAAEIVTGKSKIYVFDAVECMAAAINDKQVPESDIASLWVMRYDEPGTLTDAAKAWYLQSDETKSPMGMNFAAHATKEQFERAAEHVDGKLFRWTGVRLLVAREW